MGCKMIFCALKKAHVIEIIIPKRLLDEESRGMPKNRPETRLSAINAQRARARGGVRRFGLTRIAVPIDNMQSIPHLAQLRASGRRWRIRTARTRMCLRS